MDTGRMRTWEAGGSDTARSLRARAGEAASVWGTQRFIFLAGCTERLGCEDPCAGGMGVSSSPEGRRGSMEEEGVVLGGSRVAKQGQGHAASRQLFSKTECLSSLEPSEKRNPSGKSYFENSWSIPRSPHCRLSSLVPVWLLQQEPPLVSSPENGQLRENCPHPDSLPMPASRQVLQTWAPLGCAPSQPPPRRTGILSGSLPGTGPRSHKPLFCTLSLGTRACPSVPWTPADTPAFPQGPALPEGRRYWLSTP